MRLREPRLRLFRPALGLLASLLLLIPACVAAATPAETRAYEASVKLFQDGNYEMAEKDCAEFAKQFPESEKVAEVILLQTQARLKLKRYDDAAALLAEKAAVAGKLADEFRFWQAEARFMKGDLPAAAEGFGRMAAEFAASPRRLEASYNEAFCRFRLGDTSKAVALLKDPSGAFQQAAAAHPDDDRTTRGWLLLGEALLLAKDQAGAAVALKQLDGRKLSPELDWNRHFLLARLTLIGQQFPEALAHATNFWTAATNLVRADLLAEAAQVHAEVLEHLGRYDDAMEVYKRNLVDGVPAERRRHAQEKRIEIGLRQNKTEETKQTLEAFLTQHPQDPTLDLVRITLGELRLKDYYALRAGGAASPEAKATLTNLLTHAREQFELVVTNFPGSSLIGRAQLNRGWSLWEEGTNRLADGLLAFKAAAAQLPPSDEQTVAQFKLADCQFRLGDFPTAASNYWRVATNPPAGRPTNDPIICQALYQTVRADIEAGQLGGAEAAMARILAIDPGGYFADRSELLVGQALSQQGNPKAARARFADFMQRFTNSTLLPEVRLATAHTYEREFAWPAAINEYSTWLAAYGGQSTVPTGLVAQASFDLARLTYQTKPDTNALFLLTNFVARFPDHPKTPWAQYLAGEFYFSQADYERAELQFQDKTLAQNTNSAVADLKYQAKLMAARAAVAGQRYPSARDYLDWLITNGPLSTIPGPVPVSVAAQAYLFRGDTFVMEAGGGSTNALNRYAEAITAFSKIAELFPTNALAPIAWGRIGDCNLQLAQDPAQAAKRLESAAEAYRKVVDAPVDVAARSHAERGLGIVMEKQARLKPAAEQGPVFEGALEHYMRVFYGKNLRDGEQPDAPSIKGAGLAAADLTEELRKWDQAIGIYRRLQTELPPLRESLEKRIERALQAKQKVLNGGKPQ